MNPPVITAKATGVAGEIQLDIAIMDGAYEARIYGYVDDPTGARDWWVWPVRLGLGTHTLAGLINGMTHGIYAMTEDPTTGDTVSWPSNLVKVKPYEPVEHRIVLRREPITGYEKFGVSAYRLRISVESVIGVTKDVFLYQREPDTGLTAQTKDSFQCVCSAADLEQFPVGALNLGEPTFYRLDWIDVVEEELETIEAIWQDVNSAARSLEIQLDDLDDIQRMLRHDATSGQDPEPSLSSVSLSLSSESLSVSSSSSSFISSSSLSGSVNSSSVSSMSSSSSSV